MFIDLSHPIRSGDEVWPGDPPTLLTSWSAKERDGYDLNYIKIGEHSGTHIGAPSHYVEGGATVSDIAVQQLAPIVRVIDAKGASGSLSVTMDHVWTSIRADGPLDGFESIVFSTGWSNLWGSPRYYLSGQRGFPTLSSPVTRMLAELPDLVFVGIDGPDVGSGGGLLLAQAGMYHLENLSNVELLPPTGARLIIGMLPLAGGTGSPCRVLGVVPVASDGEAGRMSVAELNAAPKSTDSQGQGGR